MNGRRQRQRLLGLIILATLTSACTVGPEYQSPQLNTPSQFAPVLPERIEHADMEALPGSWWQILGDELLFELLERAVRANLDIRIAEARLRESRAAIGGARAAQFPSLQAGAVVSRQRQSENSPFVPDIPPQVGGVETETNFFQIGFDAAWEIDIFGGVRRSVEAAIAREQAASAGRDEVIRVVLAEVAANYAELRGLQARREVLLRNIAVQQKTLNFTENRLATGLGTELDVSQARSQLLTTQSALPAIREGIQQRILQLALLLGEDISVRQHQLMIYQPLPQIHEKIFIDIPASVLRRRPDVKLAERLLAAETADIGAATADLFPRFTLFGGFGSESGSGGSLFDRSSRTWSIGPGVSWAIFQGGAIRARIEAQSAQAQRALAEYEKSVLQVLQEVNSALVAHGYERDTAAKLRSAVEETRRNLSLSTTLYEEGLADFLSVLNAESLLLRVENDYTVSKTREWTSLIRLYKALGGGWLTENESRFGD